LSGKRGVAALRGADIGWCGYKPGGFFLCRLRGLGARADVYGYAVATILVLVQKDAGQARLKMRQ
jgi:hypothetical protein